MLMDKSSTNRYLAFDLEISKSFPSNASDWRDYRPLGISCAATLANDAQLTQWYGRTTEGGVAPQMNREDAARLVRHLQNAVDSGYQIVTWNGLGFDFDILAEESGEYLTCKEIALNHIDMMFHVLCLKGYPLSLDRAAKGMKIQGKLEGMSGYLAPKLWEQGFYQEVLDYVSQDVDTTLKLLLTVEKTHRLSWLSTSGRIQDLFLAKGWLTVKEAMQLPLPDTSWMTNSWDRSKFTSWLDKTF